MTQKRRDRTITSDVRDNADRHGEHQRDARRGEAQCSHDRRRADAEDRARMEARRRESERKPKQ